MTTSTVTAEDVRQGITDNIEAAIPGIQVSGYLLSNPTLPCAVVMRGPIAYDQSFGGGLHQWTFIVRVYVANLSDIGAASKLDAYLAPSGGLSIKAAIEADKTLAGAVQDLHVTDADGEKVYTRDSGGPVLGSEWTVEILA